LSFGETSSNSTLPTTAMKKRQSTTSDIDEELREWTKQLEALHSTD